MIVLDQEESAKNGWRNPQDVAAVGYSFKFTDYVSEGIQLFKKDIANFVFFTFIQSVINAAILLFPIFGVLSYFALNAPLTAGIYLSAYKIRNAKPHSFNTYWEGFSGESVGQLFLLGLIGGILTFIGTLFCILPGIYIGVSWSLGIPMLLFIKSDFWEALEASRQVVGKRFWSFLGFVFIVYLMAIIIGTLACGVGLLFTLPIARLAIYCAFEDIMCAPASKVSESKVQEVPH